MSTPGYRCTNRNGNTCVLIASTERVASVVVPTGRCVGTDVESQGTATFPDIVTQTITKTSNIRSVETALAIRVITLYAPMIQLNYQPTDLVASMTDISAEATISGTDRARPATTTASTGPQQPVVSSPTAGSSNGS
ncbi:conserved hypothetical protein [Verticillium alfalfae VaMs.102]|uniref:Uncharacterized protein n=1 Tax=Verticillium alfalfae (strain VaMs.102 / ATCC MYA-4576 / FGSC 10136) TaxID=526221 RepID=C9SM54_VERA1|nr:conserved hypothetical protein [Verticillium alfalfae VaMs.102]EEY19869.1 conserved hypothetical protein [Verticillium alfalfae VaMs.102]